MLGAVPLSSQLVPPASRSPKQKRRYRRSVVLFLLQSNFVLAQGQYAKGNRCALKYLPGMKTKGIPIYEEEVTVPRLFL